MTKHWIALSGGIDSCVLLHFLATHFSHLSLNAIHINHNLHAQAKEWEKHCRKLGKALKVPLKIIRVHIQRKKGESLEALARAARYQAFSSVMKKNDVLFTAHHLDDQAETLLLQLLRGAGLRGVAAMPALTAFGNGYLMRPLLNVSRESLAHYAQHFQLSWVDDPSNMNQQFDRNYLRHTIFPLLKQRWPQASKTLTRFSKHCAEQEQLLQMLAEQDYKNCKGEYLNTLSIPALQKLAIARQNNVLRYFINTLNLPSPTEKVLQELASLFKAKRDALPKIHWHNICFRRYYDHLFINAEIATSTSSARNDRKLTKEEVDWCEKNLSYKLNDPNISIKFRQGGERFRPTGKKHSRPLKKLLQEWKIPPWQRDQIPLVFYRDKILAIVGLNKGTSYASFND